MDNNTNLTAEEYLKQYIYDDILCNADVIDEVCCNKRIICDGCGYSRSIYCYTCLKLLIPKEFIPKQLYNIYIPFNIDIILDDRKASSTCIQLKTILNSIHEYRQQEQQQQEELNGSSCSSSDDKEWYQKNNYYSTDRCRLIDKTVVDEKIPDYSNDEYRDGTYLLFPGENSIPLSTILQSNNRPIKRLVVLDCKWKRTSLRLESELNYLQQIRLDNIPNNSLYWRWHNSGDGMLSSIEAIYYTAYEILNNNNNNENNKKENLIYMLWLFGIQRKIINKRHIQGKVQGFRMEPIIPFTNQYKDYHRELRKKQGILNKKMQKVKSEKERKERKKEKRFCET